MKKKTTTKKKPVIKKAVKKVVKKQATTTDWIKRDKQDPNWPESYWATRNHPHRQLLVDAFRTFESFENILEVGCASGPNISVLRDTFITLKDSDFTGVDISKAAITIAKDKLPGVTYKVASAEKLPFKKDSFDIAFTDATLIYVDSKKIGLAIKELDRVARKGIILIEREDKKETKVDGYYLRDYEKLLTKLGYEVEKIKITEETWPEAKDWVKHGVLIIARHPS